MDPDAYMKNLAQLLQQAIQRVDDATRQVRVAQAALDLALNDLMTLARQVATDISRIGFSASDVGSFRDNKQDTT